MKHRTDLGHLIRTVPHALRPASCNGNPATAWSLSGRPIHGSAISIIIC